MKPPHRSLRPDSEVWVVAPKAAPSGGTPRTCLQSKQWESDQKRPLWALQTHNCDFDCDWWTIPPSWGQSLNPFLPCSLVRVGFPPCQALPVSFLPSSSGPRTHHCVWSVLPDFHYSRCSLSQCWLSEWVNTGKVSSPQGDENDRQLNVSMTQ